MPKLNNTVNLKQEEIERLKALTHKGSGQSTRTIMHANILLFTDAGLGEKKKGVLETAQLFGISPNTVNNVRKAYSKRLLESRAACVLKPTVLPKRLARRLSRT